MVCPLIFAKHQLEQLEKLNSTVLAVDTSTYNELKHKLRKEIQNVQPSAFNLRKINLPKSNQYIVNKIELEIEILIDSNQFPVTKHALGIIQPNPALKQYLEILPISAEFPNNYLFRGNNVFKDWNIHLSVLR